MPHFFESLRLTIAAHAARPALLHRGRPYSYTDLDGLARRHAARLRQLGVAPGERVALVTAEKLPFLIAHLGTLYAGAVSLPLNPRLTREELRYYLADSEASAAVVGVEQRPTVESLQPELSALRAVVADAAVGREPDAAFEPHRPDADEPCLMIYSSGTTGWPKGVVHTHASLGAGLAALAECWRFTPDDVVVNVLPLFHVHGLCFATHLGLVTGACVRMEDTFDPVQTLTVVGEGTVFMAVPTIYYRFLERPEFRDAARSWGRVRLFTCGSAPIRADVLPELEAILGRPVINRYGMTEGFVLTSLPLDGPWPAGSVGRPLPGVELRVVAEDGSPAPPGTVGTVKVRGPNLFREYWRKPEATRAAFCDGWFDTGDLGQLDTAGFLTLVGRAHDVIITSGFNVYPQVVERVLNGCPGVRESAVFGVPDERRGERVAAAVVRDDPALDAERIATYLAERLVDYQQPREVFFVDELPRNALGKVMRRQLRGPLSGAP